MVKSCIDCPKREECIKTCKAVNKYINQDDDPELWKNVIPINYIEDCESKIKQGVSTTEAILQNYFIDRLTIPQIANKYYKSRQYIHKTIKKYSRIMVFYIKQSVDNPHTNIKV